MTEIMRVAPKEIYPRVKSGASLLVCAYDSEETFRSMHPGGSHFPERVQGPSQPASQRPGDHLLLRLKQ